MEGILTQTHVMLYQEGVVLLTLLGLGAPPKVVDD